MIDLNGRIAFASTFFCDVVGLEYDKVSGMSWFDFVFPEDMEEAKNILEKFPLGQAGLMGFDYIPLGPLSPLRIINDMVK